MTQSPDKHILGIIPARGGSKGIPGKNLRFLAGEPLIIYTIKTAKASKRLTRIILSTDSTEIAEVGRLAGIEVPFLRPAELAKDDTPTLPVIQHVTQWLANTEQYFPDIIVLLQPTSPLRQSRHIDEALELLVATGVDSVVSVTSVPGHFNPHWQFTIHGGELQIFTGEPLRDIITRRQILPQTYTRNGAIYAFRRHILYQAASLYGSRCAAYVMPPEVSVNIDNLDDWLLAEARLIKPNEER